MKYYILDSMGNLVTKECDLIIALAIAEELGGEVVEI